MVRVSQGERYLVEKIICEGQLVPADRISELVIKRDDPSATHRPSSPGPNEFEEVSNITTRGRGVSDLIPTRN